MSGIAWNPDGEQIAIAYCNLEFLGIQVGTPGTAPESVTYTVHCTVQPDTPRASYVFNIEDPTKPLLELAPPFHLVSWSVMAS